MSRRKLKFTLVAAAAAVIAAVAAPLVRAVVTDPGDGISTTLRAALKPTTTATFSGTLAGSPAVATCTASSTSIPTPGHGLGPFTIAKLAFSGCSDNFGGTDTITSNTTNGQWTLSFLDAPNDETGELPGDQLKLTIPKAGIRLTSTVAAGCTFTFAPNGPAIVRGAYNDVNTWTISNASIPSRSSSGCLGGASTGALKFNATFVITPGLHDVG